MRKRILCTGGCGFVGHHFVNHFLTETDYDIVVLDKLTYASNGFDRLRDIDAFDDKRVLVLSADFTKPLSDGVKQEIGEVDYIIHMGAESHVDNSITNPEPFVMSNTVGTMHMLNYARELKNLKCFFYFSTDEVFGPAPIGTSYKEDDRMNPTNPYSAAKAGGDMLVKAYRNSYGLPAIITRSMNIFGERQHPEKYIPMCVNKILKGETISIHANADKTKAGSRFYIHARNVADGYMHLINLIEKCKGTSKVAIHNVIGGTMKEFENPVGQDFHITGEKEVDNLELALLIGKILDKETKYEMIDFHSARPGHDLRYALDGGKMEEYGWKPTKSFEESPKKTIEWTLENNKWL